MLPEFETLTLVNEKGNFTCEGRSCTQEDICSAILFLSFLKDLLVYFRGERGRGRLKQTPH